MTAAAPPTFLELRIGARLAAVRTLNELFEVALRALGVEDPLRHDLTLGVAELVANVVDHVQGEACLTLEMAVSDGWLRISVADGSAIRPVVRELSHEHRRGRGLLLVAAIADRWGSEDHRGGKLVWFELSPPAG